MATSFVLIIQHDGFVLNADAWTDRFLDYDYVGAPWAVDGERVVGNGGFSLRSSRLLARTSRPDLSRPPGCPEDWFISVVVRPTLSGTR